MNEAAWQQLASATDDAEYARVWSAFYSRFGFRPSTSPGSWPGIDEPTPSITYDLSSAMTEENLARAEVAFGRALLDALVSSTGDGESIYALDWQHPGYAFTPDLESPPGGLWDWPVPALPNGDYYIFVSRDLSWGVFGHPWEQTWCAFGRPVVDVLRTPSEYHVPVIRRDGSPVP